MPHKDRIILDLCGGSGAWSKPYKDNGYTVLKFDIKDGQDIRLLPVFPGRIYGILAAPPCTSFSLAKHNFHGCTKEELLEGLSVVDACIRIIHVNKPYFWALENPIGRLSDYLGKPKLIFNPCDYGDGYRKRTAIWGKFKIPKKNVVSVTHKNYIKNLYHYNPLERSARRAITPPGFANAFFLANQ